MKKSFSSSSIKLRSFDEQNQPSPSPPPLQKPVGAAAASTNAWKVDQVVTSIAPLVDAKNTNNTDTEASNMAIKKKVKPTSSVNEHQENTKQPITREEATHFMSLLTKAKSHTESPTTTTTSSGPAFLDASSVNQPNKDGSLPVDAFRDRIVASVEQHTVTVIRGDTGCGKSRFELRDTLLAIPILFEILLPYTMMV
jgi:hypothetical protein